MSNVKTYSKKLDGEKNLTPNFKVKEFACNDGSDLIKIDIELVYLLQLIRDIAGKSLYINSGYRTSTYNKKVGGASNSYHLYGRAFDVSGLDVNNLTKLANSIGIKGILRYGTFVHIDTRDSIYHANYSTDQYEFLRGEIPYQGKVLSKGMTSYLVGCIQFKLKLKGYDVGIIDGIFGEKTYQAVLKFQKAVFSNSKEWDGIVGKNTWNQLFNNF